MTLRDVSTTLDWSISRLQSYESGKTQPTIDELLLLARHYSVDKTQLAFGLHTAKASVPDDDTTRWVDGGEGHSMAVPSRLIDGIPGPLAYADLDHPQPCTAIYQRGVLPPEAGGYAVVNSAAGPLLGWVWRVKQKWWMQQSPAMPKAHITIDQMLGRVVAHLTRVV